MDYYAIIFIMAAANFTNPYSKKVIGNQKKNELVQNPAATDSSVGTEEATVDLTAIKTKLEAAIRQHEEDKLRQNLPLGVAAGIVAAIVCAALWAAISVVTGYQIGYMAIGVGAAVGFMVRKVGKGVTPVFGIVAAVIAVLGCLLGNYFSVLGYVAFDAGAGIFELMSFLGFGGSLEVMVESFHPIDILFYILAVSAAYKMGYKVEKAPAAATV